MGERKFRLAHWVDSGHVYAWLRAELWAPFRKVGYKAPLQNSNLPSTVSLVSGPIAASCEEPH